MSTPWLKFYPTDWRSDPRLRMCSLAARGLWIEMLALMHEATPYGHLLVSGLVPTDAQLSVLVGAPSDQIPDLLGELEAAGVFSRTSKGVIYSRKMTRMQKKAATARNNGRKGGNPSLGKEKGNSSPDNPKVKGGVKPQKPEARDQSKEREANASQKKKRKTPIPEDAVISPRQIEIAAEEGHGQEEAEAQFSRFKSSALANDRRYANWDAAWRNWFRSNFFSPITTARKGNAHVNSRNSQQPANRQAHGADPALEQIARLAGLGEAPGNGGR